ncbi:MAG: hypothetical protein R2940_07525 [Syntrophotaleaceae bacterium]
MTLIPPTDNVRRDASPQHELTPETTFVGRFFEDQIRRNGGTSGFILLDEPGSAFNMRNGLAGLAERTLDVQYFIWEGDTTGRLLADAVIKAAQRGIRVRVLLDDLHIKGRDRVIALLDHHPRIDEAALPGNSYLLAFDAHARGKIVWQAMEKGKPAKQYLKDPETRFLRRCAATVLRILPEEQL